MPSILERISTGDDTAVTACVDEYGGLIWRLACRYLGTRPAEIEDAVQEIFVELWKNASRYDAAKGGEAAFVATIAHRRLIDWQRKLRTRYAVSLDAAGGAAVVEGRISRHGMDERPPDQLREAVKRQDLSTVAEAFDQLPDDERHAIWMSVHHGMSHRQIAAATDAPVGTVKTRLRRGFIRMYEIVARPESGVAAMPRVGQGGDA